MPEELRFSPECESSCQRLQELQGERELVAQDLTLMEAAQDAMKRSDLFNTPEENWAAHVDEPEFDRLYGRYHGACLQRMVIRSQSNNPPHSPEEEQADRADALFDVSIEMASKIFDKEQRGEISAIEATRQLDIIRTSKARIEQREQLFQTRHAKLVEDIIDRVAPLGVTYTKSGLFLDDKGNVIADATTLREVERRIQNLTARLDSIDAQLLELSTCRQPEVQVRWHGLKKIVQCSVDAA